MLAGQASARFESLRRKARRALWLEGIAVVVCALLVYLVATYLVDRTLRLERPYRAALLGALVIYCAWQIWTRVLRPMRLRLDDDEMALATERGDPEMQQALISAVQFERSLRGEKNSRGVGADSPELMARVVTDVRNRVQEARFMQALNYQRIRRYALMLAMGSVGIGLAALWIGSDLPLWGKRNLLLSAEEWPRLTQLVFDGDANERVPEGEDLTMRVQVESGPVPEQLMLHYTTASGGVGEELMTQTGDREFSFSMMGILEDVQIYATGGDGLSPTIDITVVERPRIEGLEFSLVFPEYMAKDPERVPAGEATVRLPIGGRLQVRGQSHKPLREAFVLLGEGEKLPLNVEADGQTFSGELAPEASGGLMVDVIDTDRLGSGQPPRFLLRMEPDRGPAVTWKPERIGGLITANARIPGSLKVLDDYGLTQVDAEFSVQRLSMDRTAAAPPGDPEDGSDPNSEPTVPVEVPSKEVFERAEVTGLDTFEDRSTTFETQTQFDLAPFVRDPDPQSEANRVRPGDLLLLRFGAEDNFGPEAPHASKSEPAAFRVVTREKMLQELVRRQLEQRGELERVLNEEIAAQDTLREILSPTADDPRSAQARAKIRGLGNTQKQMSRRVRFVGERYQQILWEFENNRILEPLKVREIERLVVTPLTDLARAEIPDSARAIATFSTAGTDEARALAVTSLDPIIARLRLVLQAMEDVENLAALVEALKEILLLESGAIRDTERARKAAADSLFGSDGGEDGADGGTDDNNQPPEGGGG